VQLCRQPLDGGIADVDAVQKGHQVDDKKDGKDYEVELHDEPALGLGVDGRLGRIRGWRLGRPVIGGVRVAVLRLSKGRHDIKCCGGVLYAPPKHDKRMVPDNTWLQRGRATQHSYTA
jgi:hypothetical protein